MIFSLPEARLYQKFSFGCIGAVVGRYAGRIAGGRFTLDGKEYRLTRNLKGNHLHGGRHGFILNNDLACRLGLHKNHI